MNIKAEALEAAQAMARQQGLQISTGEIMLVLGAFLQAGGYELQPNAGAADDDATTADPDHVERMRAYSGYSKLVSIRARIAKEESEAAAQPKAEDDYQYKGLYNYLFHGSHSAADEIKAVLKEMDRRFPDYYDPDTTYKEDSEAFIRALERLIDDLRKEIAGDSTPDETYGYR